MGAGNLALEKLSGRNGFQIDNTVPENSSGHYVPNGTCDVQEPCWDRTFQVTPMDYTDSHSPDALSCTTVTSKQKGLYDILTPSPIALADPHMKKGKACGEKPHDVNEVKTGSDTPCTEYLSQVDFQTALESREPEDRDADLSSMHEQLQKLLYEEEDWGYDFTCTSSEVKRLAAGTDVAKEVEGLIITGDVSAGQHVSANLTEDNQLVTELATVMNGCTDFNSLLKTDEACSRTSMGNSSLPLPVESDAMCLCSAFGHETQKPSAHLLSSSLVNAETHLWNKDSKTQPDHNRSIQMSTSQEGTIISDNVLLSCGTESPFKLKEVTNQTLEREMLSGVPTNYLGQLHYIEQDVHCTDGPIAKQADEMPAEEFHVTLCHSRIKERANLAELSVKEDSSSNFPGKNMDQFTSEEHSSVKAVDKSTKDKFQEKRTESDTKAQSGSNCGIYHVLRGNNSKDFQAESDAQNYGYYIQEHNSVIATESQVDQDGLGDSSQDNKRIKRGMQEPVFTASYKVSFLTELLLEINKDDKNDLIYEWGDLEATTKQSAPESKHVLEMAPSKSQQRGNDSSIVGFFCEMVEGLGMGSACTLSESGVSTALNTMHPSAIGNECSRNDWDSQNATNKAGNVMISTDGNQPKRVCKGDKNALVTNYSRTESIMQTELRQIEFQKDKNAQAPELQQDQCQRVKEKSKTQTAQYDREREMPMAHDIEETEVEPYMQALMDSEEQKHSGHDRTELQERNQEVEEASHTKIIPCESDAKENQKSMECDLEAAEVEPYMMALVNSREMYSWHDSINNVHPSMIPSSEQTDVSVGELVSESAAISMGHSPAGAFTACESPTLSSSEHAMGTLVSISPGASESSHHSQERLPQGKTQPCFLAATADDPCALKGERAKSQEAYRLCKPPSTHNSLEDVKRKQEIVKKKMVSKVQVKKPRLEAKENVCKNASCVKKVLKAEAGLTHKEDKREQRKLPCKKDSKAPKLLKKIQAELFSDFSGNIKLCCQFGEINEDSTITWTKDSKLLTRVQRSAGDDFPVSLAIVQAGKKDQGLYYCCLKNTYGKATAEFNLTSEVLEHLSSFQDVEGLEDIEFLQLMFREDFISESYFSNSLHGRITTEELHFGEGVHRKAFRSKVMQGLVPVFSPGHPCVLKVHNAIAYGTKNNDELVKKNYKLALQECYVQNTAREYAKIYAAETKLLEGFGEVPEVIPIFLIHRPKNNIPYATVEEELIGEFVKYSIRDGKEINFMRKDSEAGQKCCTFQHWVYEKTSGSLLITDMQGVGMKLTDVGIATLAKGYKGFKGNCSISFIDQFKALHQCNKYCEMLGLKPLQASCQKQRKPAATKIKAQPSSSTAKKTVIGPQAAKKT
ncbi:alpha-protein kinase 2 isoform X2 [Hemicordylus capensis]|uniref:alpha-protein kinase 2 isoform X2 n=1 Tax=Hemicordylus capensis TaxID=884348 RepID=UPI00230499C3|nr:alpha-protein kinase 2 isoform X2 [Hemicordylus capensis]